MRAAAHARGRARPLRRARRAGPARPRVRDGLRVRRVLRLRRTDARGLRAPLRGRAGARRRGSGVGAGAGGRALSVDLCGVQLRGPVLNGSGTYDAIAARRTFGDALLEPESFPFDAFVSKTITLEPRQGNPPPRLWESPEGLINSIGLPNKGLEGFLRADLPLLAELPVPLIVSVMGFSRTRWRWWS
ncbi:MAG: hypothetical protein E6G53_05640 [Actinobacteria bacterium]|nr:MAG: hypothetical protein E6G53_05640 [Actinomycetota bacterium]